MPELEKHAIDFPDIVLLSLNKIDDYQVAPVGRRKREFRAGEQVCSLVHIQAQGDGERERSLLGGLVIYVTANLGKMLAIEIGALVDFRIRKSMLVDQPQETGLEAFTRLGDDIIKTSGYRVSPFEVESVLMMHPAVVECAVTGVPDPLRGYLVKASIVLTKDYRSQAGPELAKEIQAFVKRTTAPYKYPRVVEFVDELPKTISGKIRRVTN